MTKLKKMKATLNKIGTSGFIIGVGSILNIYPVNNIKSTSTNCHPDVQVLKSDWKEIGNDFKSAIDKVKK
jgi:NAD-dependent SIR2 family protein deacetylase